MRCSQSRSQHNQGQKPLIGGPENVQTNRATSKYLSIKHPEYYNHLLANDGLATSACNDVRRAIADLRLTYEDAMLLKYQIYNDFVSAPVRYCLFDEQEVQDLSDHLKSKTDRRGVKFSEYKF
jgi:hypothetical protein